ncbi:MAG: AAA family ATPase [Bacteroidota bacterium]
MNNLYEISKIEENFPVLLELSNTIQDEEFHAEDDVLAHTKMVLVELTHIKEWNDLNENDKKILFIAAAFHDIGKLSCTKQENGKVISPKHAINGAKDFRLYAWRNLSDYLSFTEREKIVNLIRYHGLPVWIFEKPDPKKEIIKCSLDVPLHLLYLLAKADASGRICDDKEKLLYQVDLFKEYALENNCFNESFKFENNHHKYDFLNGTSQSILYVPYHYPKFEVFLMSGLPGSGKDYYISKNLKHLPVISLDEIRRSLKIPAAKSQGKVINTAKDEAKKFLRNGESFVWNATNITFQLRKKLIDMFTVYKAAVHIVYIEQDYNTMLYQNRNRESPIPEKALLKLVNKLEVPQGHEAHEIEYVVDH